MKQKPKYGTVEYYTEMFADFIGDIQHDSPETTENVIFGFKRALQEWRAYYDIVVNQKLNVIIQLLYLEERIRVEKSRELQLKEVEFNQSLENLTGEAASYNSPFVDALTRDLNFLRR